MIACLMLEFISLCLHFVFLAKMHCLRFMILNVCEFCLICKVSAVFGEIGDIIEVVLLRDKRTGVKQGMNRWFRL